MDVFFVGNDGGVYVSWAVGGGRWAEPVRITTANIAPPGASVTATKQLNNQLDVFFVGTDGGVYVSWVTGGGRWAGPVRITTANIAPPGASVTATKQLDNQLDVFFVGNDGGVYVSWVTGGGTWAGPVRIAWWKITSVDIGFHSNPNGYSFANYGDINMSDYTIDDMRRSFGDNAVCASITNGRCAPRPAAKEWNTKANQIMGDGRCYGMAVTSLRFFKGLDSPGSFQNGAATPYDLQQTNAERNIAYYFVRQFTDPASRALAQSLQGTPADVLSSLRAAMSNGASDPAVLAIFGEGGHAITPYAIEDRGNSIFWIKVYDNNWPSDDNRHVEINTASNTWSYDLGWTTWSGNASTHSIGIEQISNDDARPDCPWCQQSGANTTAMSQIWSAGQGNLLVVDDQGRRVGNVGGQVVAEIPGSYVMPVIGGLGKAQSIYSVPLTGTHTLLIDGQSLTQTVTTAVTQFGPGYAVTADGISLKPAAQGKLTVAADGQEATYQASDATSVNLTLALDSLGGTTVASNETGSSGDSYTFRMNGVDVGSNQSIKASVDSVGGVVAVNNAQASSGSYDLQITRNTSAGEQAFVHANLSVTAGDTQYIDYANWNGSGDIVVKIDHGSDGSIDQTTTIPNAAYQVYLPVVVR